MGIVFAIIGFVVGAIIGMGMLVLIIGDGRNLAYRGLVARHPSIRPLFRLIIVGCGVVVAYLAHGLAD